MAGGREGEVAAPRQGCPKHMVFGPCGGVRPGGACEVDRHRCPFLDDPAPRWGPSSHGTRSEPRAPGPADVTGAPPLVVCDARPTVPTLAAARALGEAYAGWCDAMLLGEHHDRVDLPGSLLAAAAVEAGARPWVTVTCRDRNAVALEAELAACAAVGAVAVHCVTGDARAPHVRPGTSGVFELDSLRLTSLARSFGLTVSVAESPLVAPVAARPSRAADKCRAGATWCFLNVGVGPADVARFVAASRRAGSTMRHVACVAVFTDEGGAERLGALPGVGIGAAEVRRVVGAPDPVAAGIERAVDVARSLLAVDGVDGVNLSGPASTRSEADRVAVVRAIADRLRDLAPSRATSARTTMGTPP